jgi:hypothetical protein
MSFVDVEKDKIDIFDLYYKDAKKRIGRVIFSHDIFFYGSEDGTTDGANKSPYDLNFYPFIPFIALKDKEGKPIGILDYIRTIQESINKANSKQMFNLAANRCMWETGAFANPAKAKQEFNRSNMFLEVRQNYLASNRIKIIDNLNESIHLMNMQAFLIDQAQRILGINDALQGIGGVNARSNVQEQNRIAQGASLQTPLLKNLYFTKKAIAKTVLKMIGQFYDKKIVVRITGANGLNKFETLNNDEEPFKNIGSILRYSVVVKEQPVYNTKQELVAEQLNKMLNSVPASAPVVAPRIARSISELEDRQEMS